MNNQHTITDRTSKDNCVTCGKHRSELSTAPWGHYLGDREWGIKCRECRQSEIEAKIKSATDEPLDTEFCDDVICPNCGEKHEPDGENGDFYNDGTHDFTCSECHYEFTLETSVSYTYSTYRK